MRRSPGLVALTRRRFATPRSAALVIVALTLLAAFVITAAPRALVGIIRDEVSFRIGEIAPASRDLSGLSFAGPGYGPAGDETLIEGWDAGAAAVLGELAQRLDDNRDGFEPALRAIADGADFSVHTRPAAATAEALPASAPDAQVQLSADPELRTHLTLSEGVWPSTWGGRGPVEVVLAGDVASMMQWSVGETRAVSGEMRSLPVRLVGLVSATDSDAERWQHVPPTLQAYFFDDGNRRPTATAAAFVDAAGWPLVADEFARMIDTIAWYPVDAAAAAGEDPETLLAALRQATATSLAIGDGGEPRIRFSTTVTDVLDTALARSSSASAILAVAVTGPLAVTVALVVLAATLIVRRRRSDFALLSARGAPLSRLRRLVGGEGLVLGVPAAMIGAALGVVAAPTDAGLWPTLLAALVGTTGAVALAAAVRQRLLARSRADLDTATPSRALRIVEGAVILLAVVAVALLVVRGIGPATGQVDPLVVAAPLLATVALALAVVRLHPLPIAAALRIADRGRGVVAVVGAARNLRGAAAGSTAVLAMLVAVAIAVFSSLILATVDRGAVTAAERQVGADVQISGPFLTAEQIDSMRALDDVVDATGLLMGDRVGVSGVEGTANATVIATDVARLARMQADMNGGMPAGIVTPGEDPLVTIASDSLVDVVGTGAAEAGRADVDIAASITRVLGASATGEVLVVDADDYDAVTGLGFYPRVVLVNIQDGADAQAVAEDLGRIIGGAHTVESLDARTAAIRSSPAVAALRVALIAAVGLALVLSVVALLLVAGVMRDERSRTIGLLRTMGLSRRQARGIIAWEFVPLGITSLIGGALLGALLPLLVLASVDLRPFTGGTRQPSLVIDPAITGTLIGAVVVALALAVVSGVVAARTTSLADILRTEED